jgi:hypothetical protein
VADLVTAADLATAGGTLILAIATFAATRSSNRAARVAERALQVGLRPVLAPAMASDPPVKIGFADKHWLKVEAGRFAVEDANDVIYMALPVRNIGQGMAVLHAWHLIPERLLNVGEHADLDKFRRLTLDLYIPGGGTGFWEGALRDPEDELAIAVRKLLANGGGEGMTLEVLYGDTDGGQRTVTRFGLTPMGDGNWMPAVSRHWELDRPSPR